MTRQAALVVALIVVVLMFVLFGGGAMTWGGVGGGMMGTRHASTGWMGGFGWMWLPALLAVGALLAWGVFGKKR
jgi:hypothetical protein